MAPLFIWNLFVIRFHNSDNNTKEKIIVKTMCLHSIYNKRIEIIKCLNHTVVLSTFKLPYFALGLLNDTGQFMDVYGIFESCLL